MDDYGTLSFELLGTQDIQFLKELCYVYNNRSAAVLSLFYMPACIPQLVTLDN